MYFCDFAQTLGHHTIVAGYVTGMVTVWNLQATGNPLFEEPVDGVPTLSYTHVLFPSALMITRKMRSSATQPQANCT